MAGLAGFVGREDELSQLLRALDGDTRLVLVVGDAGMGKTRFVDEAMERAAAAGIVMVRGECLPLAGTLPLLPVGDALGELARLEGAGCWRPRWTPPPGTYGTKWGGCCRGWVRLAVRPRLPGTLSGAGSGCSAAWRRCLPPWPGGPGQGWGWWWRMFSGQIVRRWIF
jgi:AAA ATPase domain